MSEEQKQTSIAELKKVPQKVQAAAFFAFVLGIITFLRVLAHSYATHLPIGKGIFYGLLMLFWFFIAGGSLYTRSRWGFMGLIVLTGIPLLGVFTFSVHLLRLLLEGTLSYNWPETIHCMVALVQFVTTCALFRYLFSRQTREYFWKAAP